jgi:hypothetical protein
MTNPIQNGEAVAVLQDVDSYAADQKTLILLKILALGNQQVGQGKVVPAAHAVAAVRKRKVQRDS